MAYGQTKAEVKRDGQRVLREVKALYPDARLDLWENLGWQWSVRAVDGHINVGGYNYRGHWWSYSCLISTDGGVGGRWTNGPESCDSPTIAIERAIKSMRAEVRLVTRVAELIKSKRAKKAKGA